jgi:zinc and cadmium transporter
MVSFAAGALLGDVFLHLLPELIKTQGFGLNISLYILSGILGFFILEKILHWRHCHMSATSNHIHPLATINLVGGAFHNFIDGTLIAASYALSIPVGIATTVAVILHEIPQEMGDFGVLLHSGLKMKRALFLNFASELIAFLGVFLVMFIGVNSDIISSVIIPITIGGFLYIANADLIPELHKDVDPKNSVIQLISFVIGVGLMMGLLYLPFE